jgi:hypothetical protein
MLLIGELMNKISKYSKSNLRYHGSTKEYQKAIIKNPDPNPNKNFWTILIDFFFVRGVRLKKRANKQ